MSTAKPFRTITGGLALPLRLCGVLIALGAVACASESGPSGPVVASGGGLEITLDELDAQLKDRLFEKEYGSKRDATKLHDARAELAQSLIDAHLQSSAAEAAGLPLSEWMDQEIAKQPPVDDAAVADFFETYRSRIGEGVTVEEIAPQIRQFLEQNRQLAVVEELREGAEIRIELPRVRQEIAATGPSLGPVNAPVTIVEFSDFQCPYCARVAPTLRQLRERHPENVRIVYRHLPLPFHKQARGAAEASVCADAQGKFWPFHDLLFANPKALAREQLLAYGEQVGVDTEGFEACLDDPATKAVVARDLADAERYGATGTPAFFINGIILGGNQPVDAFEKIIFEELERLETDQARQTDPAG